MSLLYYNHILFSAHFSKVTYNLHIDSCLWLLYTLWHCMKFMILLCSCENYSVKWTAFIKPHVLILQFWYYFYYFGQLKQGESTLIILLITDKSLLKNWYLGIDFSNCFIISSLQDTTKTTRNKESLFALGPLNISIKCWVVLMLAVILT